MGYNLVVYHSFTSLLEYFWDLTLKAFFFFINNYKIKNSQLTVFKF